jgi:hypothetical protein
MLYCKKKISINNKIKVNILYNNRVLVIFTIPEYLMQAGI